jgi:protein-disulfide isomerase
MKKIVKEFYNENKGVSVVAIIGIIIVGIIIASVFITPTQDKQEQNEIRWSEVEYNPEKQNPNIKPISQDPNITITYYGDFACPHCKTFEKTSLTKIINNNIANGKVELVFRPLTVVSEDSSKISNMAYEIWEKSPENYWKWHSKVFKEQGNLNWASNQNLYNYNNISNNIEEKNLRNSYINEKHQNKISENTQLAEEIGVRGTPTLVINNETIIIGGNYQKVQESINNTLSE